MRLKKLLTRRLGSESLMQVHMPLCLLAGPLGRALLLGFWIKARSVSCKYGDFHCCCCRIDVIGTTLVS
jgi:hypothetical protein